DVTPPGGSVLLYHSGANGFYKVQTPGDPMFPSDPGTPQAVHFSFSALFLDAQHPGSELGVPGVPIYPGDPFFVLSPDGSSLGIDIYHQLVDVPAVQHSHFSLDLNEQPVDP